MSKQYLTKLHNELTDKKIQHEYIQKPHLTCVKIPVGNAQPFVIEEYYNTELQCPILVTQTQTKVSEFVIDTKEDFNEYVRLLGFVFG